MSQKRAALRLFFEMYADAAEYPARRTCAVPRAEKGSTMKQQYLEAGRIVNTHGIAGEVKIQPWTDDAAFLRRFRVFYLDGAPLHVKKSRVHKDFLITAFEGLDDINAVMPLKNKILYFDRDDAALEPGTYFLADLIGAQVVGEDGTALGTLREVMELPRGRVYVVQGEREILIPAVPEFVRGVDAEAGVITVHLIEGL